MGCALCRPRDPGKGVSPNDIVEENISLDAIKPISTTGLMRPSWNVEAKPTQPTEVSESKSDTNEEERTPPDPPLEVNPWNQLTAMPLQHPQEPQAAQHTDRHFYTDPDTLKYFVDIRVPVQVFSDHKRTIVEHCLPLVVENLDESLQSAFTRISAEAKGYLSYDEFFETDKRKFSFKGDSRREVLDQCISSASPCLIWQEYMKFNSENLAKRARPMYGGIEAGSDTPPLNMTPIVIYWSMV
jgi:hypothetical protein